MILRTVFIRIKLNSKVKSFLDTGDIELAPSWKFYNCQGQLMNSSKLLLAPFLFWTSKSHSQAGSTRFHDGFDPLTDLVLFVLRKLLLFNFDCRTLNHYQTLCDIFTSVYTHLQDDGRRLWTQMYPQRSQCEQECSWLTLNQANTEQATPYNNLLF